MRVLTLLLLLFAAMPIFADDMKKAMEPAVVHTDAGPFYAGIMVGQYEIDDSPLDDSGFSVDDDGKLLKVVGGYDIVEGLAVEGAYTRYEEIDVDFFGTDVGEIDDIFSISLRGIAEYKPNNLGVFAGIGGAYMSAEFAGEEEDEIVLTFNVGATYDVSDRVSLRGEYEYFDEGDDFIEVDAFSIGATYQF